MEYSRIVRICSFATRLSRVLWTLAFLTASLPSSLPAEELDRNYDDYFEIAGNPWTYALGGNGGINKLGDGYDGYEDLGKGGADFYIFPPEPDVDDPTFKDKMMLRFSADYFPL